EVLKEPGVYEELDRLGAILEEGLLESARKHGITMTINRLKLALTVFFTDETVSNYEQAEDSNGEQFAKFFRLMLERGINLAPSKYEAWLLTTAHTEDDIRETIKAADESFAEMARG